VRVGEAERALVGQPGSAELFRAVAERCRRLDAVGDVHAPAVYRQQLAATLARRALEQAAARLAH
jgi:CO/xanthine dehydrogenase FAD-binding subunit